MRSNHAMGNLVPLFFVGGFVTLSSPVRFSYPAHCPGVPIFSVRGCFPLWTFPPKRDWAQDKLSPGFFFSSSSQTIIHFFFPSRQEFFAKPRYSFALFPSFLVLRFFPLFRVSWLSTARVRPSFLFFPFCCFLRAPFFSHFVRSLFLDGHP